MRGNTCQPFAGNSLNREGLNHERLWKPWAIGGPAL